MKPREFDPRRLDIERFAAEGGALEGDWPLAGMQRLCDACHVAPGADAADRVRWSAGGEQRRRAGQAAQAWLHLTLDAKVDLTCQRCLSAVTVGLVVDRWFRFVDGEERAAALDAESEDDVLASSRTFDLHELAEDELLLALPLVPRHEVCPQPLAAPIGAGDPHDDPGPAESPFAALAALKRMPH
ncbi:MAG: DUF177 domain-containing protein [Burkholderiaceae bacterium]|nr:DUF177 domain-containing protein [Burkholderiaceae bacterium]